MFHELDLWSKIVSDPITCAYHEKPDFMQILRDVQQNPGNLNNYLSNGAQPHDGPAQVEMSRRKKSERRRRGLAQRRISCLDERLM